METGNIELTLEQKGVLASLSQETGESVSALIDKALEKLQEHLRAGCTKGEQKKHQGRDIAPKPIWEVFADTADIPDEQWDKLPKDLATQHDHYIYHTPKRPA